MWVLASAVVAPASVVDRVVAVVGDQVVLTSDVSLDRDLSGHDPSPLPFWERGEPEQRQIDAAILRAAAGDIALYQPTDESARARLERLRATFEDRADWVRFLEGWGLDEGSMLAVLKRRMVVEAYLKRNLQSAPSDTAAWNAECAKLLADLAPRVRVRRVPAEP
ncbi:MAG: hypothetical protein H6737_10010 [Alphaproteobacteria bacterium]|nr:hypothetical protein [Alphaproteobacteria bacterium]